MDGPRMSIVLVTDTYDTIRGVVQRLGRQTVAGGIELVLVAPSGAGVAPDPPDVAPLHSHRVLEVADIMPLWRSRAAGVRTTTAPIVTVGETHALPGRGWAEAVLAAFDEGRTVVVPGFTNANPDGAISWANLMSDYGRWSRALPEGADTRAPAYNTIFARSVLDGLGPRAGELYARGFDAPGALRDLGQVIWREPEAVLYHINVSRRRSWVRERYLHGRVMAGQRALSWGLGRRVAYILGSPLIVPLVLRRIWPGYRAARRRERMPRLTTACVVAGVLYATVGEVVGFAFGTTDAQRRRSDELEVHKMRYTRHGARGLSPDA